MKIGEAAAAAATTQRALRFYEQRGLLPPPRRTASGQRVYDQADVNRLRIIRELLALGLTVEDVRACTDRLHLLEGDTLPRYGDPRGVCSATSGVVERRIAALDAEITRLTTLRDRLAARTSAAHPEGRAPTDDEPADEPTDELANGELTTDGGVLTVMRS